MVEIFGFVISKNNARPEVLACVAVNLFENPSGSDRENEERLARELRCQRCINDNFQLKNA